MVQIKDLCRWYKFGYTTIRRRLLETGVPLAGGRGNKKALSVMSLKPFFEVYGYPKELTLTLNF
jgi:hypothetical protein